MVRIVLCLLALGMLPLRAANPPAFPQINLLPVAGQLVKPLAIVNAGDGSERLFLVEQGGTIRILKGGALLTAPFLDIHLKVSCCNERGLLGLAFPPGFGTKNYFYVNYTNAAGNTVVARYRVTGNPDVADPSSETQILTVTQPFPNHNGGQLAFSPKDGYLYIGVGDGGSGGDPLGNGQNTNTLLGKILRIDVESGVVPYAIPPDNPFAGGTGHRREIWALGLRNPWRFSFDRKTGDLYIGDVGQDLYEEIDFQPATSHGGENYGWNIMEGAHCYGAATCNTAGLTLPVAEYAHENDTVGCAVIGGYIYRGAQYSALSGVYVYGDFCTGRIWGLTQSGGVWQNAQIASTGISISSFGEDDGGNLFVTDYSSGTLYQLSAGQPQFTGSSIVNAASYVTGMVPGSIATLFGKGLTAFPGIVLSQWEGLPTEKHLPQTLGGVAVFVNGVRTPLFALADIKGQQQINFQVPYEVSSGPATVVVQNNGLQSSPTQGTLLARQPGVFAANGYAAALHGANNKPVLPGSPAQKGETIVLYATGLGPIDQALLSGLPAPDNTLIQTVVKPTATIGGLDAPVRFSGLAPGYVGLYQINVEVPSNAASGDNDLVVTTGGVSSEVVKVPVQ